MTPNRRGQLGVSGACPPCNGALILNALAFQPRPDLAPGTVLDIPFGAPPHAVSGTTFTATLAAPDLDALCAAVLWVAKALGDPERILEIRLDEAAFTAELDFGPRMTRPRWLH